MSMAINRVSASNVAAMLLPAMKPTRVAKFGSGRSNTASTANSQALQSTARSQPADTTSTAEIHAGFEFALAALGSVGTAGYTANVQPSPNQEQTGVVQQAGGAYAQVEQQAGQVLDITA